MQRLYSQLIGLPLVLQGENLKLARIFDLILDPDRGTLLAMATTQAAVIASVDLGEFTGSHWEIRDADAFLPEEELVRLQGISKKRRKFIGKPVITEAGEVLGHVADYIFNTTTLHLIQLYVVKRWLLWTLEKRLIQWKEIVEITEDEVVVKSNLIQDPEILKEYGTLKQTVAPRIPATRSILR